MFQTNPMSDYFKDEIEKVKANWALGAEMHKIASDAGSCFELYDVLAGAVGDFYTLEGTYEKMVANEGPRVLEQLSQIYAAIKRWKESNEGEYDFNDLDNHINIVHDTDVRKVFTFCSPNFSFLVVCDITRPMVYVYRFYEEPNVNTCGDISYYLSEDIKGRTTFTLEEVTRMIQLKTEYAVQYWTDYVPENPHVHRPSLKWFAERDYNPVNIRSNCFVQPIATFSNDSCVMARDMKNSLHYYNLVQCFIQELDCASSAVEEI